MFEPLQTGTVICAYGEIVQDQIAVLESELVANEYIEAELRFRRGGCAPNTLAVVAALGAPARFLGHEGVDPGSGSIVEELQRSGVRVFGTRRGRGAVSLMIELPGGGTSIIFDPGASREVLPSDVRSWWLKDAAVLHMNSYHLYNEASAPMFWAMVDLAHELEVPISLDVSFWERLEGYGVAEYRTTLERVRPAVLFANEREAEVLDPFTTYPEGVGVVVNHCGPNPTRVLTAEEDDLTIDVAPVEVVVDTIGAGDVFAGGFLTAWLRGRDLGACVELAHEVAGASVQTAQVDLEITDDALMASIADSGFERP